MLLYTLAFLHVKKGHRLETMVLGDIIDDAIGLISTKTLYIQYLKVNH